MGDLILTLLHSATNAHLLHWQTTSYAQHQALGAFYEAMPGLVDDLVEAIIGKTGQVPEFPVDYIKPAPSGLEEIEDLSEYFDANRHVLPQDSEIQNLADTIADQIDKTLFLLRRFK